MNEYGFTPKEEIERRLKEEQQQRKRDNERWKEEVRQEALVKRETIKKIWLSRFPFIPNISSVFQAYVDAKFKGECKEEYDELNEGDAFASYKWNVLHDHAYGGSLRRESDLRKTHISLFAGTHQSREEKSKPHIVIFNPVSDSTLLLNHIRRISGLPTEIHIPTTSMGDDRPSIFDRP